MGDQAQRKWFIQSCQALQHMCNSHFCVPVYLNRVSYVSSQIFRDNAKLCECKVRAVLSSFCCHCVI